MIPDTETTLLRLRGGKMYEEGNEKSVKPGFGGDNTDGLRRQWRKQNGRGHRWGQSPSRSGKNRSE